jgi:hypothetical protein
MPARRWCPVLVDVVQRFARCGDLHEGFDRVRCPDCRLECLLAFFDRAGTFTPLPKAQLRALRDPFRAKVFRLLVQHRLLSPALVHKFMQWKHSGFNLFRSDPVKGTHRAELEKMAQYILRHSFAVEKLTYFPPDRPGHLPFPPESDYPPQLRGVHRHRLPRCRHATHSRKGRPNGQVLRLLQQQSPRPEGEEAGLSC